MCPASAIVLSASLALSVQPTEVAVLSTLHTMHRDVPGFGMVELAEAIERLQPDVLCLEVSPEALAERRAETVKVEYPEVVYPLIDRHGYATCTLEPAGSQAAAIIGPYVEASKAFSERSPQAQAAFSAYAEGLYAVLRHHWVDAARANDAATDHAMQGKHALQEALVGPGEVVGWAAWNTHFLEQVVEAASANPGRRIVVLVGAEHGYWLRRELAGLPGLRLLDTASLLEAVDIP